MVTRISLRIRIYGLLAILVLITIIGGLIMVWYTYRMEGIVSDIIDKNVAAFQAAEGLETALVNQKGFVTYFFLDGDPEWLRQLDEYRRVFKVKLHDVYNLVENKEQYDAVARIEEAYRQYIHSKDKVIALYKAGTLEAGQKIHKETRNFFFKTLGLVEDYKELHKGRVKKVREMSLHEARRIRFMAGSAIVTALFLSILLAFVLIRNILEPVRKLVLEADRERETREKKPSNDEVKALSRSVKGLIENYDQTHNELKRSRESLLQAEKMAIVGKLGASMAHSLRNPLTSVKMRLFSLDRNLDLSPSQKEDFQVISDEIRHVDNIVQNFLDFSRPPRLKLQKINPSDLVDTVLQLLKHRIESYGVQIQVVRNRTLPVIYGDSEQLKEVFVNLIMNACEAMQHDGTITIHEEASDASAIGKAVIIKVVDDGPGIAVSIQEQVFQPFFTTKEEGTGLGLSIAERIIAEHGGTVDIISHEGQGTSFIVTLPRQESNIEQHTDH